MTGDGIVSSFTW